jgi:cystathionine gamma-synthase
MDLVLQSATKYLAGHNDILAGAVLGEAGLIDKIRNLHKSMGGTIDPHCCYLLLRGLKTFPLRVQKQNESALRVAEFLEGHPHVKRVYYPFLKSHPHYDYTRKARYALGITDTLFRLAVGLEDTDDLIRDLDEALRA